MDSSHYYNLGNNYETIKDTMDIKTEKNFDLHEA